MNLQLDQAAAGTPARNVQGMAPTPSVRFLQQYIPGTEQLGADEMRVTFMGSVSEPRLRQSGMSIYVELGNGDAFIFDMGPGSIHNYLGLHVPLPKINNIFLTHLHCDHWLDLIYAYLFGTEFGRWEPFRIWGPSGRTPADGVAHFAQKMKEMAHWHIDSLSLFPAGKGYEIEVHEFDWKDAGGVAYEQNGVRIIHWPASHSKDGASSYRLDWNGLAFVYTGDSRPMEFSIQYAQRADIFVSDCRPEVTVAMAHANRVAPEYMRYAIDAWHTPGYAAGYLFSQTNPRMGVVTHMAYDHSLLAAIIPEIRVHWEGPLALGIPDLVVFNVTKDSIWQREGVISDFAKPVRMPLAGKTIPAPTRTAEEIQEEWVRQSEIAPERYYPENQLPKMIRHMPAHIGRPD